MTRPFDRICIVGVGLIGGSIAAAIKATDESIEVRGIDADIKTVQTGIDQGILDAGCGPEDVSATEWLSDNGSDLVILAVPVFAAQGYFERLKEGGYAGALTDVASTKGVIDAMAVDIIGPSPRYIPGHPMAGSETSGIEAASAQLFQGAYWILCPDENTDPDTYRRLHEFIVSLGARVISIDRAAHDRAVAIVSHVPHMVASSLARLAGLHANEQKELLRLAAGGFKDSTRIAAGSPELWCGIAFDNKEALADGLHEMGDIIAEFENSIRNEDERSLNELLTYSADLRRNLPARWVPDSSRLVECRIPMANHAGVVADVTGIASHAGCNIQSIDIDHITEDSAVLELVFTDEGDIGKLSAALIDGGYDFSFRPLAGEE